MNGRTDARTNGPRGVLGLGLGGEHFPSLSAYIDWTDWIEGGIGRGGGGGGGEERRISSVTNFPSSSGRARGGATTTTTTSARPILFRPSDRRCAYITRAASKSWVPRCHCESKNSDYCELANDEVLRKKARCLLFPLSFQYTFEPGYYSHGSMRWNSWWRRRLPRATRLREESLLTSEEYYRKEAERYNRKRLKKEIAKKLKLRHVRDIPTNAMFCRASHFRDMFSKKKIESNNPNRE